MNLAKWKYSRVLKEFGGPIDRISFREIDFFGERFFEAYAYLDLRKISFPEQEKSIYGNAHGSGTDSNKTTAIYKAISEALERWAWASCVLRKRDPLKGYPGEGGIEIQSNTDGFGAYPGLLAKSARTSAFAEAVERWALCSWWEEKLGHTFHNNLSSDICAIEIQQPHSEFMVVLCWKETEFGRVYGFACAKELKYAFAKAKVELNRNLRVLENFYGESNQPNRRFNLNEKRLLHFSKESGLSSFESRIRRSVTGNPPKPTLVFDSAVIGEWTKFTHVWRCLLDTSELDPSRMDENVLDYFCF